MFEWLLHLVPPTNLTGHALIAYVLIDVVLIVVLARFLGTLIVEVNQPRVVGEILAGILLGPTLLGNNLSQVIAPLEVRPTLGAIATLGLILFMFLAGTEFDASVVRGRIRQAGLLAALSVAVPAAFGFPVAGFMHEAAYIGPRGGSLLPFALFIGAALSVTAFPVTVHILMERGELNTPLGALAITMAGIMTVLMFTYISFAAKLAQGSNFEDFLRKLGLLILFGVVSWFVVRPFLAWMLARAAQGETITGNDMAVIFAGMILYGLIAHVIEVNALLGGFIWGAILPTVPKLRRAIAAKVRDVALVFLLPVFFAQAGFVTDLKLITLSTIPVAGLVLLAAVAGKFLGAAPARTFGFSWGEVGSLATLANARGLLVLVVGLLGLELEFISTLTFTILAVVALVTNMMALPLLNLFSRWEPALVNDSRLNVTGTTKR